MLFFYLLKLDVLKNRVLEGSGLDFGGSWPRFWKLQVSILDGSGIYFSKFSSVFGFMSSKCLLHRHNAKKAKVWANCSQNVGFHFPMCLQHCSPAHASLKGMAVPQDSCTQMGRRRWPPPGGVQSAGHRRCANGVLNSFPTGSVQSQLANLDILSRNSI